MKTKFIYLLVCFITTTSIFSQKNVQEAETMAKSEFKKMHKHEIDEMKITEKQYVDFKVSEYKSLKAFYTKISSQKSVSDLCSNGDFENGQILANEWNAYWSGLNGGSGNNLLSTGAFTGSSSHSSQIHHVVVPYGNDQLTQGQLKTTESPNNRFSLRLGNAIPGTGYESVSKKITVSSQNSQLSFSYAMVVEFPTDDSHNNQFPGFGINIYSGSQNYNSLINLSNGSNTITADNPILISTGINSTGAQIKYKNWSCASVDLSSLDGKEIIIEFFNRDCLRNGHWGYSYLDNICLGCQNPKDPEGNVSLNLGKTDMCGVDGKICVNYKVPTAPNPSMIIELKITQNGVIKKTLSSPNFTSNGSYCFTISQNDLNSLNLTLGGFDYHLTGKPKSGSFSFSPKIEGSLVQGIKLNILDYKINCLVPPTSYSPCCPPMVKTDIYPMFTPVFKEGASGPYTMKFTMPQSMKDGMQAYINLLKYTCKAKQLLINWQLCEVTASGSCTNLETKAVIFTAGSTIPTIPTFFTTTLQQDKQYRITLIYKYDGQKCFEKTCDDPLVKPFEWDIDKKMGTIINKSN